MLKRVKYATCPLNPKQVSIIVGSLISNYLGVYYYDNNTTRPAVSIQKPEENKRVEGLELVVDAAAISKNVDAVWQIQVLERSDDPDNKLAKCAEIFRRMFNNGGRVLYQGSNESIGSIARIMVIIPYGALLYWRKRIGLDPELYN